MADSKTVLLTGGYAPLIANLARYLLLRGQRVRVLDTTSPDIPEKTQITQIDGTVSSRPQVDIAMRDTDIVIHAAFNAPLEGTQHTIESAFAADIERFIHVSSSAVFGLPRLQPLESAPRNGGSTRAHDLIAAEDCVVAYRRRGMSVPVLRPQPLVGFDQRANFANLFENAVQGRGFAIAGRGDNAYQLLDIEDLCAAIYACIAGQRDTVNETFNLGATAYGTIRADIQAVLDHAGHGQKVTNRPFAASPVAGDAITKESVLDTDYISRTLDFAPQYSNAQTLIRNYNWYIANMHRF